MSNSSTVQLGEQARETGGSPALRGYLSRPEGEGPWPGVVVVHEAFGVDDVMRRAADRIAAMGFLALLPDLFSDGGARRCLVATLRALNSGQGQAFADIEAARRALLAHDDCTGRVGIVGFCMGGGFALLSAGTGRGFDASSVNYGMVPRNEQALREAVSGCPVVASYGGRDRSLRGAAQRLETALSAAGTPHDVREYPRAGHSFLNDAPNGPRLIRIALAATGGGPEPESAADAWRRIESFLAEHLAGGAGGAGGADGAGGAGGAQKPGAGEAG